MSQYFPKPFRNFGRNINVKVDHSNYATKADIKNISHFDTSRFALKANLASLKTEVDKVDVLKSKYKADKTELEKKFLILANLLKNRIIMLKLVN